MKKTYKLGEYARESLKEAKKLPRNTPNRSLIIAMWQHEANLEAMEAVRNFEILERCPPINRT